MSKTCLFQTSNIRLASLELIKCILFLSINVFRVIVTLEIKHAQKTKCVLQITHLDPLHAIVEMETQARVF